VSGAARVGNMTNEVIVFPLRTALLAVIDLHFAA
jgi:hypothetical protein